MERLKRVAVALLLCGCPLPTDPKETGCLKDTDCHEDRICLGGSCQDRLAANDAGAPDAGTVSDAGIQDIDQYVKFSLKTDEALGRVNQVQVLPVAASAAFSLQGYLPGTPSGRWEKIAHAAFEVAGAPDAVRTITEGGSLSVLGVRPGRVLLKASVTGASGPRTAEDFLDIQTIPLSLELVSVQDGPFVDAREAFIQRPPPATLPVDLAARVFTQIVWSLPLPGGGTAACSSTVDPQDLEYAVSSGHATVDGSGVVRSTGLGVVRIAVTTHFRQSNLAVASGGVDVTFVAEAPRLALEAVARRADSSWYPIGISSLPAGSPDPTTVTAELGVLELSALTQELQVEVAVVHSAANIRYKREVPVSSWAVHSTGAPVFALDPPGHVRRIGTGLMLWTISAAGFDLPVLVTSAFDRSVKTNLRASPTRLNYVIPTQNGDPPYCSPSEFFLTVSGSGERPLTPLEMMGLVRWADENTNSYDRDILGNFRPALGGFSRGNYFCAPNFRRGAAVSPASGNLIVDFLGNSPSSPNQERLSIPYTVTW